MTIPFLCVVAGFALNYISKMPLMWAMAKEGEGYDNKTPREQQARLTGWGKRALGAHQNSFEITPIFASCVIIGHLTQGNAGLMNTLAIAFVLSRIVYMVLYIADLDKLRSLVWAVGPISSFGIALSSFFN